MLVLAFAFAGVAQAVSYSAEEIAFYKLINEYRASNGLGSLVVSDELSEAGDRHCSDMGKYDFFDHYTQASDWFAVGASPWDRMAASGYTYNTDKGENIAAGMGTAAAVFDGWKNSPGHNANMLNPNYNELGISLVEVSGSPYRYYWATDFGGYVDPTAHSLGSTQPTTTTTTGRPTTTTTVRPGTTTTTVHPTTTSTTSTPPTTLLPGSVSFTDLTRSTPYRSAIQFLARQGIVKGFDDGTFRPGAPVTRQQFAKMLALTAGYDVSLLTPTTFTDVEKQLDPNDPFYPRAYVAACVANGAILGKDAYTFAPYDPLMRAQLITMVARAAQLPPASPSFVPPFPDFSSDHYTWAVRAAEAGLLDGLQGVGPSYNFWLDASRGEVCQLLANLLR